VVQLDDLGGRKVARRLGGETHHQHGADGEVGSDEQVGAATRALRLGLQGGGVIAGRPQDHVHAGVQRRAGVGRRAVGRGEVDQHVGAVEDLLEARAQRGIGPAAELEVLRCIHRRAHRPAHAPGGSGHRDADHRTPARIIRPRPARARAPR
jgi:hypothetical protein